MTRNLLYLDHAATTPLLPAAREAMVEGFSNWANPSSPHRAGRAARFALEEAREKLKSLLGWNGEVIFTSGASEALAIAIQSSRQPLRAVSAVEHDAALRHAIDIARITVDENGVIDPAQTALEGLVAVQQVNSETGVMQPLVGIAEAVHDAGGRLLADCAQGAGKLSLPDADMIALAAHKFGGPIGIGALLVKDWAMLEPGGGQERGYRGGTENVPAVLGMLAALEAGSDWMPEAARLRALLEQGVSAMGGEVIAKATLRCATIGAYRMPGMAAAVQLIRFDSLGIAVSAGSACSSGSMRTSHVLAAMGIDTKPASEVIRVSIGRETCEADVLRFLDAWREIAPKARAVS